METCDKELERAEQGNWKFSSTHSTVAQSKWLRGLCFAAQRVHRVAERTSKPGGAWDRVEKATECTSHRKGICAGCCWFT